MLRTASENAVSFLPGVRRWALSTWITGAAFLGAFLSRSVWLPHAQFHPDESTVLWMALDAVRHAQIPDHGLVSSYNAYQPPGLVWVTMPFVALGGGRPEIVIVAFALVNAAAIAFLVATVARFWGLVYALALGSFLVVGPDAFYSALVWHPSLYTGAIALILTAGVRLRHGSAWWAVLLAAVPGLYALIHYSGLVLFGPALALLVLSRRRWASLILPVLSGTVLAACAWGPFLSFEADRKWVDLKTIAGVADNAGTSGATLDERYSALGFALSHLGQSVHGSVLLTPVIWGMVLVAFLIAVTRRRWRDPGFALPAAVLASGVAAQVAANQGERTDVLMLWLVPLYALAAWAVVQTIALTHLAVAGHAAAPTVAGVVAVLVVAIGSIDLARAIGGTPGNQTLSEKWRAARADAPVRYDAGVHPALSANTFYLPCDPPYDWGSEIWYLEEVLHPGSGLRAAVKGGAFRWRQGQTCTTLR
jgi:4-amino-4-deoxy-L-arabinose transferase-like glycosyltransferase